MFQERFQYLASLNDPILVLYDKDFLGDKKNYLFRLFERDIEYNSNEDSKITLFGKHILIPRKQVAFGEDGVTYTFSGVTVPANNWNVDNELCKVLLEIRNKVAKRFSFNPNFVLINRYENGDQYIGYHSDDEADLNLDTPIVGISLGSEREILFKSKTTNKVRSLLLGNGSMYAMLASTNQNNAHSIPKRKGVKCPRISLTFREMKN